jgi:multicomponent K+:H+ antiporter subunit E
MRRLLSTPVLSAGLLVLWLLLTQSVSLGHVVLGLILALCLPALTAGLRPLPVRARKPLTMARLFAHVLVDMLRSNAMVAHAILTRPRREVRSGFVNIPLDLHDSNGLAVLAMIVTFTPGTAWVQLSGDRRLLLLHVLALEDEVALVQLIKHRYERPLMEIFP